MRTVAIDVPTVNHPSGRVIISSQMPLRRPLHRVAEGRLQVALGKGDAYQKVM